MFLADSHTHSNCSPDGTVPMCVMAQAAQQAGLHTLCLTDHCDLLSLDGSERITDYDWSPVLEQRKEMLLQCGTKLDLPLGLEFGMGFLDPGVAARILSQPGLDFVIGSVHNKSEAAGGGDFYFASYETEKDCYQALDDYFDSLLRLSASPFYDVIGHISYPLRYMRGAYMQPICLSRYTDHIRTIFTRAVDTGRGMEVNTWKGQSLAEWLPLLQEFRACHGEIVTVGSDAHAPEVVGSGVREAYQLLREAGFRYVADYRARQPVFHKIS